MRQILIPLSLLVLISCNGMKQSKPKQINIVAPESKPTNFETNDSSCLKINIQNENFEILFLNTASTIKNINALDSFLLHNKDRLNKDKVLVTGFENNEQFKGFKDLLLKYGISKFGVNSE